MDNFKKINLEIETITPIHIGSGENYIKNVDVITLEDKNKNKISYLINPLEIFEIFKNDKEKLFNLGEAIKNNKFIEYVLENVNNNDLKSILNKSRALHYIVNDNIKKLVKTKNGKVYIPGSSLKGSIRTSILKFILEKLINEGKFDLNNEMNSLLRKYSLKEKYADQEILKKLLGNDPFSNLMKVIKISDSNYINCKNNTKIYPIIVFNTFKKIKRRKTNKPIITFLEFIDKNVIFKTSVNIEEFYFERFNKFLVEKENFDKYKFKIDNFDNLIDMIDENTISYIYSNLLWLNNKNVGTWFSRNIIIEGINENNNVVINNSVRDYLINKFEKIIKIMEKLKEDETILPIGYGIGWYGMTGGIIKYYLSNKRLRKKLNLAPSHSEFIFPKTRRFVYVDNQFEPIGFIKVKFDKLKRFNDIQNKINKIKNYFNKYAKSKINEENKENYTINNDYVIEDKKRKLKEIEKLVGKEIIGEIKKIVDYGIFVNIIKKNDGLLHISKIKNYSLDNFKVGDRIKVKIENVEYNSNRNKIEIKLSLVEVIY